MQNKFFSKLGNSSDENRKNKKSLLTVYVSLFLALGLFSTATFSWFTLKDTATIKSDALTMNASSGLRVNEGESITNVITLDTVLLSEASSVDGRNIFFPLSGNFTDDTMSMKFREGSVGDQNKLYAYKNFTLTGDSTLTEIYLKSYKIQVDNQTFDGGTEITNGSDGKPLAQVKKEECPIRIAFITDSADAPIVIDPTALVDGHVHNYNAIKTIASDGSPIVESTNATSFSNHYFSYNKPFFRLFGSESKNVTMVVWLEGTSGTNSKGVNLCDRYEGKEVHIEIELESNFTDTEIITFIDDTIGDTDESVTHWINSNKSCIVTMAYTDTSGVHKTVVMKPYEGSTTKWYAPIPKNVTSNIAFYRYSLTEEIIYNAWYTKEGVNDETSDTVKGWLNGKQLETERTGNTYTAMRGNGYATTSNEAERLSPCIGFWDYDNASGGGSGEGGGESGDTTSGGMFFYGFAVNFSDKAWITQNVQYAGYTMYVIIGSPDDTSGQDGDGIAYALTTDTIDYKRAEAKNIYLDSNSKIKRFELRSTSGHIKKLYMKNGETALNLDLGKNYSFIVNISDMIE